MKQGSYRGKRGRLHRHGRPRRTATNIDRTHAAIRRWNRVGKY
jgi:hypothetical protein